MPLEPKIKRFITRTINYTCKKCNVPGLIGKVAYAFDSFGDDILARSYNDNYMVVFSADSVDKLEDMYLNNKDVLRELIVHETCHIIAHHLYGENILPHGKEWKGLMETMGYFDAGPFIEVA